MTEQTSQKEHTSATSLKTFDSCQRKWFLEKVAELKTPETEPLRFGKAFHSGMENCITCEHGDTPKETFEPKVMKIIEKNLKLIKELRIHYRENELSGVEEKITVGFTPNVDYLCYIDFFYYRKERHTLYIHDHKTVSEWKWALTKEDLQNDLQMNLYMFALCTFYKELLGDLSSLRVIFVHNQFNKRSGVGRQVKIEADNQVLGAIFNKSMISAEKTHSLRTFDCQDYKKVEPNWEACRDWGGCPFFDICHRDKPFKKGDETMSHERLYKVPADVEDAKQQLEQKKQEIEAAIVKNESEPVTVEEGPDSLAALIAGLKGEEVTVSKPKEEMQVISEKDVQVVDGGSFIEEEAEKKSLDSLDKLTDMLKEKKDKPYVPTAEEISLGQVGEMDIPSPVKEAVTEVKFMIKTLPVGRNYGIFSEILKPYIQKIEKQFKTPHIHLIKYAEGVKEMAKFAPDIYKDCQKFEYVWIDNFIEVFSYLDTDSKKDVLLQGI